MASHAGQLLVYSDLQCVWAAKGDSVAVAAGVTQLGNLPGLVVTLDEQGSLVASYMGTAAPPNVLQNSQVRPACETNKSGS